MKQKVTLFLGVTLAIAATLAIAPLVSEMAFAIRVGGGGGVIGGGISNACSNEGAAEHNPNCNSDGGVGGAGAATAAAGGAGGA